MPNRAHSTKYSQRLLLPHTLPQTMAQAFTGGGQILINFAQIDGDVFVFPRLRDGLRDAKMVPDQSGGDLAARTNSLRVSLRQPLQVLREA
jgi:hypothetical protein